MQQAKDSPVNTGIGSDGSPVNVPVNVPVNIANVRWIAKPNGRTQVQATLTGAGRKRLTRTFGSRQDGERWVRSLQGGPEVLTVPDMVDAWGRADHSRLAPNTVVNYRSVLRQVAQQVGPVLPGDADWSRAVAALPVSRQGHAVCAVRHLAGWAGISVNVAASSRATRPDVRVMPLDLIADMLARSAGTAAGDLLTLAVHTAMRREELLGLQAGDVLDGGGSVMVRRAVTSTGGMALTVKSPKTRTSIRRVHLGMSARQIVARRAAVPGMEDPGWLFPGVRGPWHPRDAYDACRPFLPEGWTFRDLRHVAPTRMLEAGVAPKVVQELMGHSSVSTTMDIYAAVVPQMHADAVEMLDKTIQNHPVGRWTVS